MTDERSEFYVEKPEFFCEGQTTLDGYIWQMQNGLYAKIFQGEWDERSR